MNTTAVLLCASIVAVALLVAFFFRRRAVRIVLATLLFIGTLLSNGAGLGGLRAHIERARAEGHSEDFVAGMIERQSQLASGRLEIAIFGFGLFVLCMAGGRRRTAT